MMNVRTSRRHRHFFALPLFAAALCIAALSGSVRLQGDVLAQSSQQSGTIIARGGDRTFSLPNGTSGVLREDGILVHTPAGLSLTDGTVLASSPALMQLHADDTVLSVFHGALLVSKTSKKLSILALTAPVLLERGLFRFVIPEGMQGQWNIDDLPTTMPAMTVFATTRLQLEILQSDVEREQRKSLAQLPDAPLPLFTSQTAFLPILAPFALPGTQQRIDENERQSHRAELEQSLSSDDAGKALTLLRRDDVQHALRAPDLPAETLPTLLANASHLPSVAQELIAYVTDPDLWLLLSFHKDYRAAAWETSGPLSMPLETRMLRWLLLPSSDVSDAVPARAIDQWQAQVAKFLESSQDSKDALQFIDALLQSVQGYRAFAEVHQYPERLAHYAHALQAIIEPFRPSLSSKSTVLYTDWNTVDAIAPYSEPPPASIPSPTVMQESARGSSSASSLIEPFDAGATEARAKQLLQNAGALFTIKTTLEAKSGMEVAVSGLIFASPLGEHQFDFTLNLSGPTAEHIERNGELLPYNLPLEAFGKWARRDAQ